MSQRKVFSWVELLVAIFIIFFLIALLLPAVNASREPARRMQCANQLKQIGRGLHGYLQVHWMFPPGTICTTAPFPPSNQYDVWGEAAKKEKGFQGTSFLLQILPFIEADTVYKQWDFDHSVGYNAEHGIKPARVDIKAFYCPSRRSGFRQGLDNAMMLTTSWTGGGTDYGGCAGRHAAFTLQTGYNLCDASMHYDPEFVPLRWPESSSSSDENTEKKRWGIFGRVNVGTGLQDIRDGASNTLMIGELQRITSTTPTSKDGWAIGGPATLFTTGAMIHFDRAGKKCSNVASPEEGSLINNMFWGSPGSDHPGGANFGMSDGSVRFFSYETDPVLFALGGSMADAQIGPMDEDLFTSKKNKK
jgi:prepilin-type processing-associated H-X9-DG protein